jgi:hypothetical protein
MRELQEHKSDDDRSARLALDYATVDPQLKRPRGPAPLRMYARDALIAVTAFVVFVLLAIYAGSRGLLPWP